MLLVLLGILFIIGGFVAFGITVKQSGDAKLAGKEPLPWYNWCIFPVLIGVGISLLVTASGPSYY